MSFTESSHDFEVDVNAPTELYDCIQTDQWNDAVGAVKKCPVEAKIWVATRDDQNKKRSFLPLHSACARSPPDALVKALLDAFPDAASTPDDYGMLPIHYATGNYACEEVISTLLSAYPNGASTADTSMGMLPLHYVSEYGASANGIVHKLLSVNPDAVNAEDYSGNTPLDLATGADYNGREEIMEALRNPKQSAYNGYSTFHESPLTVTDVPDLNVVSKIRSSTPTRRPPTPVRSSTPRKGSENSLMEKFGIDDTGLSVVSTPSRSKSHSVPKSPMSTQSKSSVHSIKAEIEEDNAKIKDILSNLDLDLGIGSASDNLHDAGTKSAKVSDMKPPPKSSPDRKLNLSPDKISKIGKSDASNPAEDKLLGLLDQLNDKSCRLEKELNEEKAINGGRLVEMSMAVDRLKQTIEMQNKQIEEKNAKQEKFAANLLQVKEQLKNEKDKNEQLHSELNGLRIFKSKAEQNRVRAENAEEETREVANFVKVLQERNKEQAEEIDKLMDFKALAEQNQNRYEKAENKIREIEEEHAATKSRFMNVVRNMQSKQEDVIYKSDKFQEHYKAISKRRIEKILELAQLEEQLQENAVNEYANVSVTLQQDLEEIQQFALQVNGPGSRNGPGGRNQVNGPGGRK